MRDDAHHTQRRATSAPFPLTAAQRGIWFAQHLLPETPIVIANCVEIRGALDVDVLERVCIANCVEFGSAMLRIVEVDGVPMQIVDPALDNVLRRHDFRGAPDPIAAADAWMADDYSSSRDLLSDKRLIMVAILQLGDDHYYWYACIHHIALDGYAAILFLNRCIDLYSAAVAGHETTAPRIADLVEINDAEDTYRTSTRFEKDRDYWAEKAADLPAPVTLATRSGGPDTRSRVAGGLLPERLARALADTATALGTLDTAVTIAAVAAYVARLTDTDDLTLSLPVSARTNAVLRRSGGMVSNVVPLRFHVGPDVTFADLVAATGLALTGALRHQRYRSEDIRRDLGRGSDGASGSERAFFGPAVNIMNFPSDVRIGAAAGRFHVLSTGPVEDLSINVYPSIDGAARVDLEANPNRYTAAELDTHHRRFLATLTALLANPAAPLADVDLLDDTERSVLVPASGGAAARPLSLPQILSAGVAANPEGAAVVCGAVSVSYRELDAASDGWAALLGERGARPESFVALALPRGVAAVVAMWAIAKSGAALVPVDPTHPDDRIRYLLTDSRAVLGVSDTPTEADLPDGVEWVCLDDPLDPPVHDFTTVGVNLGSPAYVIYTSGTTGQPKGVLVTHTGLTALTAATHPELGTDTTSRMLRLASATFDASVFEMLHAFSAGATLVIAPPEVIGGDALTDLLRDERVTHALIPPAILSTVSENVPDLQTLIVGGDVCPPDVVTRFAPRTRFHNAYGPSEATVITTMTGPLHDPASITLGALLTGFTALVRDTRLRPVPPGVVGELYIAGPGLARGYHGRPGLTAARFVADPTRAGGRLYRTGDLVRWHLHPARTLTFVGRGDDQVQLNGIRVEPAELDSILVAHPSVDFAHTTVHQGRLVSYLHPTPGHSIDPDALHAHTRTHLPPHLQPTHLVVLTHIPLTPNGKLDRAQLPAPELTEQMPYRAPSNPVEQVLADAVATALGRERVGVDESFFALGGDSIMAIQLVSAARAAGLMFTPRDVFERKTIAALAAVARRGEQRPVLDELPGGGVGIAPLTPIAREVLARSPHPHALNRFYQAVAVRAPADLDLAGLERAVTAVVAHHDTLRATLREDGLEIAAAAEPDVACVGEDAVDAVDAATLQTHTNLLVDELDPWAGQVLRVRWLRPAAGSGVLLLVAHHVVVDAVSWRILVADLAAAWSQHDADAITLAPVGTSLRRWAHALTGAHAQHELEHWTHVLSEHETPLGARELDDSDTGATLRRIRVEVPADVSDAVLNRLPEAYRAGPDDVLLSALALAIAGWQDRRTLLVSRESHGRDEDFVHGADLSRTVGWFTTSHPVRLDVSRVDLADRAVKRVKEQLRTTPGQGTGYGVLASELPDGLAAPQVAFNYLGRIATGDGDWLPLTVDLNSGSGRDLRSVHALDINAAVGEGGRLHTEFAYPRGIFEHASVEELGRLWQSALHTLARLTGGGLTPSDVARTVDQGRIERWEHDLGRLDDIWALSPLQAGLLFHAGLTAGAVDPYSGQVVLRLAGTVDADRMRRAARRLLDRHSTLRSAFGYDDAGVPAALVLADVEVPWREVNTDDVEAVIDAERAAPFDMARAPLLRFALVRRGDATSLVITNHHILFDGWSLPLVVRDLVLLYATDAALPSPAPSFRDYLTWLTAQDRDAALESWRAALAGVDGATLLVPDAVPLRELPRDVGVPVPDRLGHAARGVGVTVNTVVQAAWAVLLGRLLGRTDVVFGATVSGRPTDLPTAADTVGLFINTVPVRAVVTPDLRVRELLNTLQRAQADLLDAHHVGLSEVVSAVGDAASFDTLTVFESYPVDRGGFDTDTDFAGMRVRDIDVADATHYPLALVATLEPELRLTLEYAPECFDPDAAQRIASRLGAVLDAFVTDTNVRLSRIDVLDAAERTRILCEWNDTQRVVEPATLVDLLDVWADAEVPAVTSAGCTLSYAEFTARTEALARRLAGLGVGPASIVGVAMRRGLEYLVAIHAAVRAGAAYLPIDPDHPVERTRYVLGNAAPTVVLATTDVDLPPGTPVLLDSQWSGDGPDPVRPIPDHLAYLLYTSGSTGRPKAVGVTHRAIVNRLAWMQEGYPLDGSDGVLHKTPATFDVSVWELFWPLLVGARLVIAEHDGHRDPRYLASAIEREHVTTVHFVPSMLDVFTADADLSRLGSLRRVFTSGEALPRSTAEATFAGLDVALDNLYGPTEAAVDVTFHPVRRGDPRAVPIGRPVWNTQVYVLDAGLGPVPVGVAGELYLAGVQLARGYHRRPDLTADRFVANPFGTGERMYRTGDLVRWTAVSDGRSAGSAPVGELEYLGRADFQVKLRGQRIELGEIEAVLRTAPGVTAAAVRLVGDRLVGYVTPDTVDPDAVTTHATATLPAFMVPADVVVLGEMPLGATGKLDRRALPEPQIRFAATVPVRTTAEATVAGIFADLLGHDSVGATGDYFALGGNSLTATRAIARINAAFDTDLGVRTLFEAPTVAVLAELAEAQRGSTLRPALVAAERPDPVPLSTAQLRMWLLNRFDPSSGGYNIAGALRLSGGVDVAALSAAVADVVGRHEILRTRYPETPEGPVQEVMAWRPDVTPVQVARADVAEVIGEVALRGFDVAVEVPVRVALLRVAPTEHVVVLVVHHIAADGWSLGPLTRDLMAAYLARTAGGAPQFAPLPVQYADYAIWKSAVLGTETDPGSPAARQLAYWTENLAELPALLALPTDRPRPAVASMRGATVDSTLDTATYSGVRDLARARRATPFMVVHAVLAVLLARLSGSGDVAVGTAVSGRGEPELDDLVGMFVNTLVLRTRVDPATSFDNLLAQVRATDLDAFAHADAPFERLVEVLAPTRSTAHHPLFQVSFALEDAAVDTVELPGLTVTPLPLDERVAKFDLQVTLTEAPDGTARVRWTFASDLFDASTVESVAARFDRLLHSMITDPSRLVGDADLLDAAERSVLVPASGGPAVAPVPLPLILAAGVAANPDGPAVVCGETSVTYRELDAASDGWAAVLVERGAGPETMVALALPRGVAAVVAMWAIAKTGAAYVPIDPTHPGERIRYLLTDSQAVLGVSDTATAVDLPDEVAWLRLDEALHPPAREFTPVAVDVRSPAYVLYTSGTTGQPKGVLVTHNGLATFTAAARPELGADTGSRVLRFASATFDASVFEMVHAFSAGATLVIAPPEVYGGDALTDVARHQRVTHVITAPAVLSTVSADLPDLRTVVVGGDVCPPDLVARFGPGTRFHNSYGPTETTIVTTMTTPLRDPSSITLGDLLPGSTALVLDSRLRPVPAGVVGELYLAGAGLARGYHRRPGLTAARFVPDPTTPGGVLYRTGDLVRWQLHPHRALVFAGRSDDQVQLNGIRVEPAELDATLVAHPSVDFAYTTVHESRLVSYLHATPGDTIDPAALHAHTRTHLPPHLQPTHLVVLTHIPLTPNGKLDRAQLPAPDFRPAEYVAPETDVERDVADVFARVTGTERVGRADDFFALGGNSLSATQVVGDVRRGLGVVVSVRALFEAPTVAGFAALVAAAEQSARPALEPRARPERIPLSPAQTRMWFLNRLDPESVAYTIPVAVRLTGDLDVPALQAAVSDVLARHESLRTVYPDDGDGPVQMILPVDRAALDLDPVPTTLDELPARVQHVLGCGFDVTTGVPIRASLFALDPTTHVLVLAVHHISGDRFSTGPLARDVLTAYLARRGGAVPAWLPLPVQYADYALWQRKTLGDSTDPESPAASQLGYWRDQLAGLDEVLALPTDHPRPPVASQRGSTVSFTIAPEVVANVRSVAHTHGASMFMVTHAAFALLLSRLSGSADVAVGTPVAGRGDPALDDLVGMFVNTLVLRTIVDADASFAEVLAGVRDVDLAAFGHSDIPFEEIVDALAPTRSRAHTPLFQVLFAYEHRSADDLALPGLSVTPVPFESSVTRFDLALTLGETATEGELTGLLRYATDLFAETTITELTRRYTDLLAAVVADPSLRVATLELLSRDERRALVPIHGLTGRPARSWSQLVDAAVAANPDGVAVVWAGRDYTYAEVDAAANRLARALQTRGAGPEVLVTVAVQRSLTSVVAIWAVAKTGAAFVPVDPTYPSERIAHMLTDSGAGLGVTTTDFVDDLPGTGIDWTLLDEVDTTPTADRAHVAVAPEHPAYVVYTSGSTGRPKGVVVPNAGLANLAADRLTRHAVTRETRFLHNATISFDMALGEQISALSQAATLVIAPTGMLGTDLTDFIVEQRVSHTIMTPSLLATLDPAAVPDLLVVGVGGEAAPADLVTKWAPGREMRNGYGPTEATDIATSADLYPGRPIAIGALVPGFTALVLDDRLRPVPPGVVGELYLAGPGLARGYHHQFGLTAARFVANPTITGTRLYRTGDLVTAHLTPAGVELRYLGRSDTQIKVRGNRIEPGEIEAAATAHPDVAQAVVDLRHTAHGPRLALYVVATKGHTIDIGTVREHLSGLLARAMLPDSVTMLGTVPLAPTGKVDRTALPEPEFASGVEYEPPRTEDERVVADVFAAVTGAERVGRHDDFFALGGNSLSATQVVARVNTAAKVTVTLRAMFEHPTVAGFATVVAQAERDNRPPLVARPRPERVPLSPAQSRMWFLNRFDPDSVTYTIPVVVRLDGALDVPALQAAVGDVLARHESLRTVYPETGSGPVQAILDASQVHLPLDPEPTTPDDLPGRIAGVLGRGFDVTTGVPIRVALYALDPTSHVLVLAVHHISADGISTGPLTRDLVTAYTARRDGSAPSWAPLPVQYADYALWQREILGDETDPDSAAARQLDYWREHLAGIDEVLALPTDRPRPAVASYRGAAVSFSISTATADAVRAAAAQHGVSVFMATHAAFALLLSRLSGSADIAIGTPIAGRGEAALDDVVGMFVNTLVLRTAIDPGSSFADLLTHVRDVDLEAFAHSDVPFEQVVETFSPTRSRAHSPLFQVAFALAYATGTELVLPDITLAPVEFDTGTAQFDLVLTLGENPDPTAGFTGVLRFATDLFDESTAVSLARRYVELLGAVVADPSVRVDSVDLLSEVERGALVPVRGPAPARFASWAWLVSDAVAANPAGTAVVWEGCSYSYREVDSAAARVAQALRDRGAGPETLVAVAVP
ncbi:MAG TPA: amino acid adenylation domain-containing protein, partial [Aldersonia sp.]